MNFSLPQHVELIIDTLYKNSYKAYIVGGCVRDLLIGTTPHDFDLTTNATPQQVAEIFAQYNVIETGIKHGTVTVVMDSTPYEITTFRVDGEYTNNRQPSSVEFTSELVDDLARRDLTINAMAYNHNEGFIDHFNGVADLKNKIIRAVGEPKKRFEEDNLRVLRAIRFSAVLGFDIEPLTKQQLLKFNQLAVSSERINSEFCKTLLSENFTQSIEQYRVVYEIFLPELSEYSYSKKLHSIAYAQKDIEVRLALFLSALEDCSSQHNLSHTILKRLKFSNSIIANVLALINYIDTNIQTTDIKFYLSQLGEKLFYQLIDVHKSQSLCSDGSVGNYDDILTETQRIISTDECWCLRDMNINGSDLIQSGIEFADKRDIGNLLNQLLKLVVYNNIDNEREALLEKAKELYKG